MKCDRCDGDGKAHGSDRPFESSGPGTYPGPCPVCKGSGTQPITPAQRAALVAAAEHAIASDFTDHFRNKITPKNWLAIDAALTAAERERDELLAACKSTIFSIETFGFNDRFNLHCKMELLPKLLAAVASKGRKAPNG